MTIFAVSLGSSSFSFCRLPYPSYKFDGVKFLESGKSSFRFLHVHSHIDPVNYVHVLEQVVGLRYCQFSYGVSTKCIGYNYTICMEPIGFACVTAPVHLSSYCNQYTSWRNRD